MNARCPPVHGGSLGDFQWATSLDLKRLSLAMGFERFDSNLVEPVFESINDLPSNYPGLLPDTERSANISKSLIISLIIRDSQSHDLALMVAVGH